MIGCVHGRFQPLHNEHLEYILSALELCDHLVIGITQPEIYELNSVHGICKRVNIESNPLEYDERVEMITRVLSDEDIDRQRYSFKKFYIDEPEKLESEGISKSWLFFTTIREDWNKKKISVLKNIGFDVRVLYEDYSEQRITSTGIRKLIIADDDTWKKAVPESCAIYLEEINLKDRLCNM